MSKSKVFSRDQYCGRVDLRGSRLDAEPLQRVACRRAAAAPAGASSQELEASGAPVAWLTSGRRRCS